MAGLLYTMNQALLTGYDAQSSLSNDTDASSCSIKQDESLGVHVSSAGYGTTTP